MKKLKLNLKPVAAAVGAIALTLTSGSVMAQEAIDLTAITGAFSASDVVTAVLAVAGVLATIYATMIAAKMALRWIRGG